MKARVLVHDDDLAAQTADRERIGGVDVLLVGLAVIMLAVIMIAVIMLAVIMLAGTVFLQGRLLRLGLLGLGLLDLGLPEIWLLEVGGPWRGVSDGQHLSGLCVRCEPGC